MGRGRIHRWVVGTAAGIAAALVLVPATAATAATASSKGFSGPAPGSVSCVAVLRVTFSPPLTPRTSSTRARVRGTLAPCAAGNSSLDVKKGTVTGTLGSGFGAHCSWSGGAGADLSVAWKARADGSIGGVTYDGPATLSPTTLVDSGSQAMVSGGDEDIVLPGAAHSATMTGSFPATSAGDTRAALRSAVGATALATACRQKGGLRALVLQGTMTLGPGPVEPSDITAGPGGALWFSDLLGVGRITTAGAFAHYDDPDAIELSGIAAGPDGNLWFTDPSADSIGRLTPAGGVTYFSDGTVDFPLGITAGPDGALWFTDAGSNSIGRITTAGAISNFADPSVDAGPVAITTGPDGDLWFVNEGSNSIGQMTTSGSLTLYYSLAINGPSAITAGPDGALWYTNEGDDTIGRITTAGSSTSFSDPTIDTPDAITAGPDGALWFTNGGLESLLDSIGVSTSTEARALEVRALEAKAPEAGGRATTPRQAVRSGARKLEIIPFPPTVGSIGRITTGGVVSNYTATGIDGPNAITAGPDGALWFTNAYGGTIGRITTSGSVSHFG